MRKITFFRPFKCCNIANCANKLLDMRNVYWQREKKTLSIFFKRCDNKQIGKFLWRKRCDSQLPNSSPPLKKEDETMCVREIKTHQQHSVSYHKTLNEMTIGDQFT